MVWYATRESVMSAADIKFSAYMAKRVEEALESASRQVESLVNRPENYFVPTIATRYFDWPNQQNARTWRLWLGQDELISLTSLVSGGVTIPSTDYFLEPVNEGPPYDSIEVDLDSVSSFSSAGTHQRQIVATGQFGYKHEHRSLTTAAEAINASETTIDLASSAPPMGCGTIFEIDDEHFECTEMSMIDTAVNIDASDSMTASANDTSILCSTATAIPQVGETILIDSERMLVVDLASTTLTVKRAYDGTVLATHAANSNIFAPRRMTMVRGVLGTTAASHLNNAAVEYVVIPGPVAQLTRAYALDQLQQEGSAYARTVGSGEGERPASGRGIRELEDRVKRLYRHKARTVAV
jgi:hypothetical protein